MWHLLGAGGTLKESAVLIVGFGHTEPELVHARGPLEPELFAQLSLVGTPPSSSPGEVSRKLV
jgi:hypothetical protein